MQEAGIDELAWSKFPVCMNAFPISLQGEDESKPDY